MGISHPRLIYEDEEGGSMDTAKSCDEFRRLRANFPICKKKKENKIKCCLCGPPNSMPFEGKIETGCLAESENEPCGQICNLAALSDGKNSLISHPRLIYVD